MPMNKGMQEVGGSVEAKMIKLDRDHFPLKAIIHSSKKIKQK